MHDAVMVRGVQTRTDLFGNIQSLLFRQTPMKIRYR